MGRYPDMIIQATMVFLIGVMAFVALPVVIEGFEGIAEALTGKEFGVSESVSEAYRSMSIQAFGKLVLVRLANAGWRLRSFSYESGGKIQAVVGSKKEEWNDPKGRMGRLCGRPFAVVHEEIGVAGAPHDAAIAEKMREQDTKRDREYAYQTSDGETAVAKYNRVGFDSAKKAVDFDHFPDIVQGSVDPQAGQRAKSFKEKAFAKFNTTNLMDYGLILMAFAVGFGAMYLGAKLGSTLSGGRGSSIGLPIHLAGVIA
jgi:hypothetical protein